MAVKDRLRKDFLLGIRDAENILISLHFNRYSFEEKGYAYFVKYKKGDNIIEFLFGPSDWDVEMIIFSTKGKFGFKELLQIPVIALWVKNHRYKQENQRDIRAEILWFLELLKISLPIVD